MMNAFISGKAKRRFGFLCGALSALLLGASANLYLAAPIRGDDKPKGKPRSVSYNKCAELIMREGLRHRQLENLDITSEDYDRLVWLREELVACRTSGVVVYSFVKTAKGMATVRFESQNKEPLVEMRIVALTQVSEREFNSLHERAMEPSNNFDRNKLSEQFMPDMELDQGKMVFFKDLGIFKYLPAAFNRLDATSIASASLAQAIGKRGALSNLTLRSSDFSAFVNFPRTQDDYRVVFPEGGAKLAGLDAWKDALDDLLAILQQFNVRPFAGNSLKDFADKQSILKEMEGSRAILFLVAHADGCFGRVIMPNGGVKGVEINPGDIATLTLRFAPFVIVRVCGGLETGYARAFMQAGASGVWINGGACDPATVNEELQTFFSFINEGADLVRAIAQVKDRIKASSSSTVLMTQIIERVEKWIAFRSRRYAESGAEG